MDYTNVVNQPDINVALDELSNIINTCTAECMKKKSSCSNKNRKNEPWYTPNLHSLRCKKERAYKKFIQTGNSRDNDRYKTLKNKYFKTLDETRIKYFLNNFQKHIKDSKATWALINRLLGV